MKRMEERQIQGLHRMAGRWAANCLWASVSLFFVHFVLSCLGSPWDPAVYGDVLIKSPVWFRLIMGLHWIVRMCLFAAFGWEILQGRLGLMALTALAGALTCLLFWYLEPRSYTTLWDGFLWFITAVWSASVLALRGCSRRWRNLILAFLLGAWIGVLFDADYWGRYGSFLTDDWYYLVSWLLQDVLRISATLELFLWLMTLDQRRDAVGDDPFEGIQSADP